MNLRDSILRKAIRRYLTAAAQYKRVLAKDKNVERELLEMTRNRVDVERERLIEVATMYFADRPEIIEHIKFVESGEYTQKNIDDIVENLIVKYIWGDGEVFQLTSPRCLKRLEEALDKFTSD